MKGLLKLHTSFLLFCLICSAAANAGVLFDDNFESGTLEKVVDGTGWNGGRGMEGEMPEVSSDISRSGTRSLKFTFLGKPSGKDSWSEQRFKFGKNLNQVFLKYYVYYPDGTEGLGARYQHRNDEGPDNNKFLRVWDDHYSDFNIKAGFSMLPSSSGSYIFPEKGTNGGGTGLFEMPFNKIALSGDFLGRWLEVEIYIKTDDGAGNGAIRLTVDGKDLVNLTDMNIVPKDLSKNYFKNAYFFGWSASGFSQTTHIYLDDLIVSDSPINDIGSANISRPQSPNASIIIKS